LLANQPTQVECARPCVSGSYDPSARSIAHRLIWMGGRRIAARIVGVIETNRREAQRREVALTMTRTAAEFRFAWLMVEAERQRVEHAVRRPLH
jgi:hypothetical protein